MPESVRDRLNCRHELIFLLVKQPSYWFDLDPIRVPHSRATQAQLRAAPKQSSRRPARGPKGGSRPPKYGPHARAIVAGRRYGNLQHARSHRAGHPRGRNPGDVWAIPTRPYRGPHFAAFPIELPLRCIAATATTGVAAVRLGRRFTGIELSAEFADLAADRLRAAKRPGDGKP